MLVHPERDSKTMLDLLFGDISEWLPSKEKLLEQSNRRVEIRFKFPKAE